MMKSRKTVYLLLGLVLAIWGTIVYRVLSKISPDAKPASSEPFFAGDKAALQDTFALLADYPDPFLGQGAPPDAAPAAEPVLKAPPPPEPVKTVAWPVVRYTGIIKNMKKDRQFIVLQVNGKDHLVTAGQQVGGVQVEQIFKDSVLLSFEGEKKYLRR
jgi:hypothetical protein